MPASRMRLIRWVRNGTPAVGIIGLGTDRVSGRSRVPRPPTRITASIPVRLVPVMSDEPATCVIPHHEPVLAVLAVVQPQIVGPHAHSGAEMVSVRVDAAALPGPVDTDDDRADHASTPRSVAVPGRDAHG